MTSITCIGNANTLRAPTTSGAKHPWPDRTEERSRCCTTQASP